jgi:DNA repair photolyase
VAVGATVENQALQVGQRLGDCEAARARLQVVAEKRERHGIAGLGLTSERSFRRIESLFVMRDQRVGAAHGILDRLTVARQREAWGQLDRLLQRGEVVAERVRPALGPEADRRRDRIEQVVGSDEDVVTEQAKLTVRVTGRRNDGPATHVIPGGDRRGRVVVADVRPVVGSLLDQLVRDVNRDSVPVEPIGEPLWPVVRAPHEPALVEVDLVLEDGCAGQLGEIGGGTDVVGVEVGDEDRRDRAVELRELGRPALAGVRRSDPGVDERPAVVSREEVGMDVPGPRRQRRSNPANPAGKLLHPSSVGARLASPSSEVARATQGSPQRYEHMFYPSSMRVEYREEPCRSALNRVRGMPFAWSLNPYMGCVHRCTFCYVRAFEARADRASGDGYGSSIRVKTNIADVLRRELARPSWCRENVTLGAATDPYQAAEARYRLTRACIVELARARTPFGIITRGPLVVRDIDVLQEAIKRVPVSVNVSVPTLDEHVWRTTEPGTAPPRQRLEVVRRLAAAGLDTAVAMAPILPGLSDAPEQLEAVVRAAREAGASKVWASLLYLKPGTREHFLGALARDWPEELERYERLYAGRAYLPRSASEPVRNHVRELTREAHFPRRPIAKAPVQPEQLTLAV